MPNWGPSCYKLCRLFGLSPAEAEMMREQLRDEVTPRRGSANRHKVTILFLGKAMLCALLIIWLAQYLSSPPQCDFPSTPDSLPGPVQQALFETELPLEWRCPHSNGWTVSYQLQLVDSTTNSSTVPNVTTIQVLNLEVTQGEKDSPKTGVPTSLPSTCLSSASSCACLVEALQSTDCFLHDASDDDIRSHKVLDEQAAVHSEATHRMFKIYFVLSTFLLGIGLASYCILRLIQACCASGGKKAEEGEA